MTDLKTNPERIDREAADWVVKWEDCEREPAPKEQSRWFDWLRRSPRHVQAYFDTADLYARLGRMDPQSKIDVDEWLAEHSTPVMKLAGVAQDVPSFARRGTVMARVSLYRTPWAVAAALAVLAVGGIAWNLGLLDHRAYRTAVGEQSLHRLSDGSLLSLNTRSQAKVEFSDHERLIELEGEALFTVAGDPARPFLVRTRGATVRAIGTKFNVQELAGETRVAVIEGSVQVIVKPSIGASSPSAPDAMALSAGESAQVLHGQLARKRVPDVQAEIAWQHQQLVFEDTTLAKVADEFNRYNTSQIRVDGSVGQSKRLSGTFDALHPQSLLLYLKKDPSVTVQPSGDDFVVRGHGT